MTHLQKALHLWIQAGHTQAEFAKRTGIEQSICSRIFSGLRGLTQMQREAIFEGFSGMDLQEGLLFLKAELEDLIPKKARPHLRIFLEQGDAEEIPEANANRVEKARKMLMEALKERDPHAMELAVALYDWRSV